jgi:hypothetical protein
MRRLPPRPGLSLPGLADLDGLLTGRTFASWTGEANGPFPGACAATVSTGTGATG